MTYLNTLLHTYHLLSTVLAFIAFYVSLLLLDSVCDIINGTIRLSQRLSSSKAFLILFFLSSFLILSFFADSVLQRFPVTGAEYNYVYQGETFLKGRLWNTPPPQEGFFEPPSPMVNKDGKWVTRSFPGWPSLLAVAMLFRIPIWLLNPLFGTASLIALFLLAKLLYNNTVGLLSVAAGLCAPFFIFNATCFQPHPSCGLCILLAVYSFCLFYTKKNAPVYLCLVGICLGAAYSIRPFSTLCCVVPILISLIMRRKLQFFQKDIWFFLLGLIPFLLANFLYNYLITGSFLISPFNWTDPGDTVQFFNKSVITDNLYNLKDQLLWMNPALLTAYFFIVIPLSFKKTVQVYELFFLVLVTCCFFYFVPKESYGARYYFEGYLLCVLTVIGRMSQFENGRVKRLVILALMAGFFTSLASIPALALHYKHKIFTGLDMYRLVEEKHLSNAIVFMPPGTYSSNREARNDPDLQNPVLYAHDLKEKNALLLKYFPSRVYYLYVPEEKNEGQRLQMLDLRVKSRLYH